MLHLAPTFSTPDDGISALQLVVGVLVAVLLLAFFLWIAWMSRKAVSLKQPSRMPVDVLITVTAMSLMLGFFSGVAVHELEEPGVNHTHHEAVASWLDDAYGVDVSADAVSDLLNGQDRVVRYQGADVLISLVPSGNNHIAVISADDHTILAPKDGNN